MTGIDRKFASLIVGFVKFITLNGITFQDVKSFIADDLVAKQLTGQEIVLSLPLFTNIKEKSTLRDLMLHLNKYWSFFNFALLEKLIKKFMRDDNAELKQYISNLEELSVIELPVLVHPHNHVEGFSSDTLSVTMVPEFSSFSCEKLRIIHSRIAGIFRIECFALLLKEIKQNENKLEFIVAETAYIDVQKLTDLDLHSFEELYIDAIEFQGVKRSKTDEDNSLDDVENLDEGT